MRLHAITAALAMSLVGGTALAQDCGTAPAEVGTIEVVTFRLVDGTSEADFIEAARATLPYLCGSDGFVRRSLSHGDDGTWTDHVAWMDEAAARRAAEAAMEVEDMMPFMTAIDPETMSFRYETAIALN